MSEDYAGILETVGDVIDLLEADAEERKRRKRAAAAAALLLFTKRRKRQIALALGLIGQGPDVARAVAVVLPKRAAKKLRRKVDVAAFQKIGPRGALSEPVDILPGDTLYLSPVDSPGAGTLSKDASRVPYAVAGEIVPAGIRATIQATLYEKLWLTDGKPCEICEENSIAGWIPIDKTFPSGDWEPKAHPNCKCSLETRRI